MTCVVGIRGRKGVLLAGDSQASTPWTKRMRRDAKTVQLSDVLAAAYCGSFRLGQLLTYHLRDVLEDPPLRYDEHKWAVKTFPPHLRDVVADHGVLRIHHNVELLDNSCFLLAVRGRLFVVDEDFQVGEDLLPFSALGSGEDVAAGAIAAEIGTDATEPVSDQRLERIARIGLNASSELTTLVGGPLSIVRTVRFTEKERAFARSIMKAA